MSRIAVEGRNCWRRAPARRVAFLVDGAAYFDAFAAAAERAERSILILAWDVHSGIRLRRDAARAEGTDTLGGFLRALLDRRPALHVNVLDWDFAMIYALEREVRPILGRRWAGGHPRLHFQLDAEHPLGASHHQKVVVIDDAVAFVGGLDLAACRWDTPAHAARDPRRVDPGYGLYAPFHDVQVMVDGAAAAALATLARERWERATGVRLPAGTASDPWPPGVAADLTDVPVAIARTEPRWDGRPGVYEVERLLLDAIAAARRAVYLEMQYLTGERMLAALAARLRAPDAPEVVIVAPRVCSAWLEEATMGVLRGRFLRRLAAADRFGRLRVFHPVVPGLSPDQQVNVHAKVMIADDAFVRIGSSNASNRSMRLDTECDVAIEAEGAARVRDAIAGLRDRLLGEHLGVAPARVADAVAARGSLVAAIDALRDGPRTLAPIPPPPETWVDEIMPDASLVDPDEPIPRHGVVMELLLGELSASTRGFVSRALIVLLGVVGLAAAWHWTPLGAWVGWTAAWVGPVRTEPLTALVVVLVFVGGGFLLVPTTGLMLAAALVFGPLLGFAYALLGAFASATAAYALGRLLARGGVRRLSGRLLRVTGPRLARRTVRALATGRAVPIAPFTVVNLLAGAARVDARTFVVRTAAILTVGTALMTFLAGQFAAAVRRPGAGTFGSLLLVLALVLFLGPLARRHWGASRWTEGEQLG